MDGLTLAAPRRDTARVFLFDRDGRLVLIRRTRPGVPAYLVTPGGGLEPGEDTVAAAARECAEELGAQVLIGPVAAVTAPDPAGTATFHVGIARRIDQDRRTGHELREPERGTYETVRVPWDDAAALSTLRPPELRAVVAQHGGLWVRWAVAAFEAGADPC